MAMTKTTLLRIAKGFLSLFGATVLLAGMAHAQGTIGNGSGQQSATIGGTTFQLFTYRPANCSPRLLLMAFHGVERDAGPYRDHARTLANRLCAIVVSPEFDNARFPTDSYQYGGVSKGGTFVPPGSRPVDLVAPLVSWAQAAAGQPGMPFILIGHSAGAQFLSRVAAFTPTNAARIVIANPSTWVMPDTTTPVPYGFGRAGNNAEDALRAYLARPVTVLLGLEDTGTHNLATERGAAMQGPDRLTRGRNAFNAAQAASRSHGWPLGWTLVEVPGVGHSSTRMFSAPETIASLRATVSR
jgi:hypothetical protein